MDGNCRLCQQPADLQESHIVPSFVFRWLKSTSPTPFIRNTREPERRAQDGVKRYWLCQDCEQALGVYEKKFASKIFHPITKTDNHPVAYSEWLLKFCVSVSWRALLLASEEKSFVGFSAAQRLSAEEALHVWREFLCGRAVKPGGLQQHLLIFDEVGYDSDASLPPNINRYLLRSIELDIPHTNDFSFTFVKMGPFAILGFIYLANSGEWSGGEINVKEGMVGPSRYILPPTFLDYLTSRARKQEALFENLSNRQRAIADKATDAGILKNKKVLPTSHWMKAIQRDIDLFGDAAFKPDQPPKPDKM